MTNYWPDEYAALDFEIPENLIATSPVTPADHARLMVIDRASGTIGHDHFYNLGKHLAAGDKIFYNATRVESRRVFLKRGNSEKLFECVFLKCVPPPYLPPHAGGGADGGGGTWQVLMRNIRRLKDGEILAAAKDAGYTFTLQRSGDQVFLTSEKKLGPADFSRIGEMPIPPYMKRTANRADSETYQNFFLNQIQEKEKIAGSAASPTAALHFTAELHECLRADGIEFHPVCLDIGYGTFAPLSQENFEKGKLHAEHFYIPPTTGKQLRESTPGRKVALGTTTLRAILSYQRYEVSEGETQIFVKPGDKITGVDALITNFHLPRSSLVLLTAAFCGEKLLMKAYSEAISRGYRFYSYGDAMLMI